MDRSRRSTFKIAFEQQATVKRLAAGHLELLIDRVVPKCLPDTQISQNLFTTSQDGIELISPGELLALKGEIR